MWRLRKVRAGRVLAGLRMADGSEASERSVIHTSGVDFRDDLIRLALHAGYSARFDVQYKKGAHRGYCAVSGRARIAQHDSWAVAYADQRSAQPVLHNHRDIQRRAVPHGVQVWCPTVPPHGLIIARRFRQNAEGVVTKASRPIVVGQCARKFSLKTVTMLAIQLLHRIEHHHTHHYLHRDIKPDNFLMGLKSNAHTLYLIDMGLCKQYRDADTLTHIPYRENKKLIGTPRYASINTHLGVEQCRRDDLESIGYMLMYFLNGKLPWQGLKARTKQEKYTANAAPQQRQLSTSQADLRSLLCCCHLPLFRYDKISNKKMNISIEQLCKSVPAQFCVYLTYCCAEGSRVALADQTTARIETIADDRQTRLLSFDPKRSSCVHQPTEGLHLMRQGVKHCVELVLEDGRKLICTPDHRIRTTRGDVKVEELQETDRVLVAPEGPLHDAPPDDWTLSYQLADGRCVSLHSADRNEYARCLAFARMLGRVFADGSLRADPAAQLLSATLYVDHALDADSARADIALLLGCSPADIAVTPPSTRSPTFDIHVPPSLAQALRDAGCAVGKKLGQGIALPAVITHTATPVSFLCEFLAALFGCLGTAPHVEGDGWTPVTLSIPVLSGLRRGAASSSGRCTRSMTTTERRVGLHNREAASAQGAQAHRIRQLVGPAAPPLVVVVKQGLEVLLLVYAGRPDPGESPHSVGQAQALRQAHHEVDEHIACKGGAPSTEWTFARL